MGTTKLTLEDRDEIAGLVAQACGVRAIARQLRLFRQLPVAARCYTTLDNGRQNHQHGKLKQQLGMQAYFIDPYSRWQRVTNENTNGLRRRYAPK